MAQIRLIISRKIIPILCVIPLIILFITIQNSSNETFNLSDITSTNLFSLNVENEEQILIYRRQSCSCKRPLPQQHSNLLIIDETKSSLCSQYSTLRGRHQRIISISMFGFAQNSVFNLNSSMTYLYELISDMKNIYPNWILRIYHDSTIHNDLICSIECAYNNVDFCNASSLGNLGSVSSYIPPKIWRFLPAGDELVDVMASRDLDSPLTQRELAAVNEWLSSGKAWHTMRDNPMHFVAMLGGMWGFRPALNRTFANFFLQKMLNHSLVNKYGGRGDQGFLSDNIWPYIDNDIISHDSFLCMQSYSKNPHPWPTRRLHPSNDTHCFVGCSRPCCQPTAYPFGECPEKCRLKNHIDWIMC
ncbi:hypothetical protein I4U23_025433 [Adineta vaga]|nr:hypothetical protein I4U23_025433 [Adineta vaga]